MKLKWTTKKPDFKDECLVICASRIRKHWEYSIFTIEWVESEDGRYLGWLTGDGDEYGDLADMQAQKYLVLPLLKKSMK